MINKRDSKSLFSPLGTERGAAFATALVVLLVLPLLGTVLLIAARKEVGISIRGKQANQAFHVAEAGIEYGLNQLVQSSGVWRGPVTQELASADSTETIGSFTVAATFDGLNSGLATYTLESTGTVRGSNAIRRLTAKVEQTAPLWSYILFLNDKTTTDYDFISYKSMGTYYSDETTGSVHSNDDLYVYSIANGYPIFNGQITYVNNYVLGGSGIPYYNPPPPNNPKRVASIEFPIPDCGLLKSKANESGNLGSYLGNVSVKLIEGTSANNNGTIEIVTTGIQTKELGSRENVLYVENGNVYVQGTLDGRLTIVAGGSSAGDVYVVDNVRYADTNLATSDDMLGLIAENDIEIYEPGGSPWGKGPHTAWKGGTAAYDKVYVDAVMFAQSGHISYQGAASWERELLFVNGALIQNKDTAIISKAKGTMGGGGGGMGGKTGYLKRYNYDKRLTYTQPPYFFKPDSSRYRISSWGEGS